MTDFGWLWHCTGTKPPRFIVPCPSCGHEDESVVHAMQSIEMCVLCCGHGRVPRIVAERYELARRLTVSRGDAA